MVPNVLLNGNKLPWVKTAKHLGNYLSTKIDMSILCPETKTDLLIKRAVLFERVHQIMQQFGYMQPELVIRLFTVYATSLYGSCLWQLNCKEHLQLNKSWNTALKIIWDLPLATHTRFLERLSPVPHLESVLTGRYIGFLESLAGTKQPILSLIFSTSMNNRRTKTGQNIWYLIGKHSQASFDDLLLQRQHIKRSIVNPLDSEEVLKVDILRKIALIKKGMIDIHFDEGDLDDMICTD